MTINPPAIDIVGGVLLETLPKKMIYKKYRLKRTQQKNGEAQIHWFNPNYQTALWVKGQSQAHVFHEAAAVNSWHDHFSTPAFKLCNWKLEIIEYKYE